ncbi:nuclease [Kitasatospora sp. NPDC001547]|uniref:nuclease n=1 Tax=Kitasatospora sp. NPDC001547 TaxID=3364015 RepID=UPI0036B5FF00|nr:nuclease [Kitasatospora sp. Xyl93]
MTMTLIKGTYQIKDFEPDGDTVHFLPDDITIWSQLPGEHKVKPDDHGGANLRLDGIDALETHFQGVGPDFVHQPLDLGAHAARDALLTWLGFTDVEQGADEKVTSATPEAVSGFILTSGADTYGRCVAMVGKGVPIPDAASGTALRVDVPMLHQTANHELLSRGLVYPTFYKNLPKELRLDMAATAQRARAEKAPESVWANDVTHSGATIGDLSSLTDQLVIMPKLFRRVADYLRLFGPSLEHLPAFLAGGDDEYFLSEQRNSTKGLHRIIDVIGDTIKLRPRIEDIVFVEK